VARRVRTRCQLWHGRWPAQHPTQQRFGDSAHGIPSAGSPNPCWAALSTAPQQDPARLGDDAGHVDPGDHRPRRPRRRRYGPAPRPRRHGPSPADGGRRVRSALPRLVCRPAERRPPLPPCAPHPGLRAGVRRSGLSEPPLPARPPWAADLACRPRGRAPVPDRRQPARRGHPPQHGRNRRVGYGHRPDRPRERRHGQPDRRRRSGSPGDNDDTGPGWRAGPLHPTPERRGGAHVLREVDGRTESPGRPGCATSCASLAST